MATEPYEVLIRMRGGQTYAHTRTLTIADGNEYENPPVDLAVSGPEFNAFKTQFNAAVMAENQALRNQLAQCLVAIEQLETERDALAAQVVALTPIETPRLIYPYEFMERFTLQERIATLTVAQTDVQVALILSQLQTVQRVDLDAPQTIAAVGYLQSIGILTAPRAAQILA